MAIAHYIAETRRSRESHLRAIADSVACQPHRAVYISTRDDGRDRELVSFRTDVVRGHIACRKCQGTVLAGRLPIRIR